MKNTLKCFIVVTVLASSTQVFAGVKDSADGGYGNYLCHSNPEGEIPDQYYKGVKFFGALDAYAHYMSDLAAPPGGKPGDPGAIIVANDPSGDSWDCNFQGR